MAGCHVGAMEARATVTRHRLWTCVTFQLGCPASQSESVQPWRGGCRLTLIMSHAHVKDDETPPRGDAGVPRSLCATRSGGSLSRWTLGPQQQCTSMCTQSHLAAFSSPMVLT